MGKARVYLGRIPYAARVRDIEDFFRGYGKINDISLKTGFAFVEFDRSRDAEDAVDALNGRSILGERVIVELAKGTPRGGDVHRYGSRSPGPSSRRSRSRSRSSPRNRRERKRSHSSGRSRDRSRSRRKRSRSHSRSNKRSRRTSRSPRHNRRSRSSNISSRSKSRSPVLSPSRNMSNEVKQARQSRSRTNSRSRVRAHRRSSSSKSPSASYRSPENVTEKEKRKGKEKVYGDKMTTERKSKGSSDEEEMEEGWNDFNDEEDIIDLTKSEEEEDEEEKKVTTFHDLPDELLFKIGKYVGSKNGLKLRMDKQMDERMLTLLKLDYINFRILENQCELTINRIATRFTMTDGWSRLTNMGPSLRRWAQFTTVQNIVIAAHDDTLVNSPISAVIHSLLQFNADRLIASTTVPRTLPQLDFASLLVMSANIREVRINHICSSVEATDLLCLRNALLDGGCKLEAFTIDLKHGIGHDFIKKCFNVTIVEQFEPVQTIEYQNPPTLHPVQLYAFNNDFPGNTVHFEREIKTEIEGNRFSLIKVNGDQICQLITVLSDIRLNHTYTYIPLELLAY